MLNMAATSSSGPWGPGGAYRTPQRRLEAEADKFLFQIVGVCQVDEVTASLLVDL